MEQPKPKISLKKTWYFHEEYSISYDGISKPILVIIVYPSISYHITLYYIIYSDDDDDDDDDDEEEEK